MANFCGKCGSPIDQTTGLCPKCSPQAVAPVAEKSTSQIPVITPEDKPVVTETTPATISSSIVSDADKAKDNNSKSKKKLIRVVAIVLTALILIGGGTLGALWLLKDKGYPVAGKGYLISNKYGIFYQTGSGVINLKEVEEGPVTDGENTIRMNERTAYADGVVYAMPGNEADIYKAEFESKTEVDVDIWMSKDELTELLMETDGLFEDEEDKSGFQLRTNIDWQHSDGYIYFTLSCDRELLAAGYGNASYRIARINIEDKELEVFDGDIRATNYVVDGKWIYYCESGFIYEGDGRHHYDKDKAGIYKVKTDGSDKEKLLDVEASDENWDRFSNYAGYTNISIFKDRIYFIDNTEPFENRICRMKKNGKDMEEVSSTTAHEYVIDSKRNRLYYIDGSIAVDNTITSHDLIEVRLNNLKEDTIAEIGLGSPRIFQLICHDSVLYFHSFDRNMFSPYTVKANDDGEVLVGLYYDLKKEKATGIYAELIYGEPVETVLPGGAVHQQSGALEKINYSEKEYETTKLIEFK